MHQEDLALQRRCVGLYQQALAEASVFEAVILRIELASARRHSEIIERFGRFPHRNAILGRDTTPEEATFLKQPFSSF